MSAALEVLESHFPPLQAASQIVLLSVQDSDVWSFITSAMNLTEVVHDTQEAKEERSVENMSRFGCEFVLAQLSDQLMHTAKYDNNPTVAPSAPTNTSNSSSGSSSRKELTARLKCALTLTPMYSGIKVLDVSMCDIYPVQPTHR